MIEIEIDRKRLNYNENLKFMPFGKSFHFYAIWELCHLGSYHEKTGFKRVFSLCTCAITQESKNSG